MCDASKSNGSSQRIDWAEAERSGALNLFTSKVQENIALGRGKYDSVVEISREVEQVTQLLTRSAEELLPSG